MANTGRYCCFRSLSKLLVKHNPALIEIAQNLRSMFR
jgi:hypothetical protein